MNIIFLIILIQITLAKESINCIPLSDKYSNGFLNDKENKCFQSESVEKDIHLILSSSFLFDSINSFNTIESTEINKQHFIYLTSLQILNKNQKKQIVLQSNTTQLLLSQSLQIDSSVDFQIPIMFLTKYICYENVFFH